MQTTKTKRNQLQVGFVCGGVEWGSLKGLKGQLREESPLDINKDNFQMKMGLFSDLHNALLLELNVVFKHIQKNNKREKVKAALFLYLKKKLYSFYQNIMNA